MKIAELSSKNYNSWWVNSARPVSYTQRILRDSIGALQNKIFAFEYKKH